MLVTTFQLVTAFIPAWRPFESKNAAGRQLENKNNKEFYLHLYLA